MSLELLIIFISIGSAAIAYELVFSPLKRILFLDREYPIVELISSFKFYRKLLGTTWAITLLPLIVPMITLTVSHRMVRNVLACIYCTSFWLSLVIAYLLIHSILFALITAGVSIFCQTLNNFIKMKSI